MQNLTKEEQEFLQMNLAEQEARAAWAGNKKAKFHKWGKEGPTTKHYCVFLYIPKKFEEKFGGTIPLPKKSGIHRNITMFKKGDREKHEINLFPQADRFNIQHVENGVCHVCERLNPIIRELEERSKHNEQLGQKLDTLNGKKNKNRIGWLGIALYPKEDKTYEKVIEIFDFSYFYWKQSYDEKLLMPRTIDIDDWVEENADDLKGMSEEQIQLAWRKGAEAKFPLPWNMQTAYVVRMTKSGFGLQSTFEVAKRESFPYSPMWMTKETISKMGEEEQKKSLALMRKTKENFLWLKSQFQNSAIPDLGKFFDPLTSEEQYVLLGMDKETDHVSVSEEDDLATLGNKIDDLSGDNRASVDLDLEDEEENPKKSPKKQKIEEDEVDDLDLEDEEEKPKKSPKKHPKKKEEEDDFDLEGEDDLEEIEDPF